MPMEERTRLLLGEDGIARLRAAHVLLFGLGGVGSYAAEALARAGVGALTLVDDDTVSESNLNRQLIALRSTVGLPKVEAEAARIADIAPGCRVTPVRLFYGPQTAERLPFAPPGQRADIPFGGYSYIIDAVDTVSAKLEILQRAAAAGLPAISCMGTGNKLHPECLRVGLLEETQGCPLARVMRRECRRRGLAGVRVVYSTEPPRAVFGAAENAADAAGADSTAGPDAPQRPGRPKRNVPGSVSFVPGAAGLLLAAEVVRALAGVE